jgi:putative membrane protein
MTKPRKPASFRLEEVEIVETPTPVPPAIATGEAQLPATVRALPALDRGWRWGSILLTAVGGLVGLASAMWLHDLVRDMMARQDWIGWTTISLLGVAGLALLMIVVREAAGLARLGRLGRLRHEADSAAAGNDKALAIDVLSRL